jgi:hypothetical protein
MNGIGTKYRKTTIAAAPRTTQRKRRLATVRGGVGSFCDGVDDTASRAFAQ